MQLISIALFYVLILFVGIYASRRRDGDDSAVNLLLAGRRIPLFIGVITMTATPDQVAPPVTCKM